MNKAVMAAIVMLAFVPAGAFAQERAGDAALGAVSGAVVLGPIGAVAGAFVGYAAGPSIARSWGLRGSRPAGNRRPPARDLSSTPSASAPPRTQEAMNASGQMRAASNPPVQAAPPAPAAPTPTSAPPIQGFE
jgi:hypothetical protein